MVRCAWLLIPVGMLLMFGCGGGGTEPDPPDTAVFISATVDDSGDFIEVEMIKEVTTNTAIATISAGSRLSGVTPSVGTIRLERYEVTYVRKDGGAPGVPTISGGVDRTLAVPSVSVIANAPTTAQFEFVVFPTSEKTFSAFAQSFSETFEPVSFDGTLRVFGRNLAGDPVQASAGFEIQAAVFQPIDALLPIINSLNEVTSLNVGDDYFASWTTANRVDDGTFVLPWGVSVPLPNVNNPSPFPIGTLTASTDFLADTIDVGETRNFPSGVLIVSNPFGTTSLAATGGTAPVSISVPPPPPVDPPDPINILEFFSDRTNIVLGESVNLIWAISGGADLLQILPSSFSGIPVDFSGKDPSFDTVSIAPDFTVRPILRATRVEDGIFDQEFLQSAITVNQVVDPSMPANIEFFQVSDSTVREGRQTVFFWEVTGGVDRVELFPINGQRIDVSDRNSFLSPPLNQVGLHTFSLVAFSLDGTLDKSDITVNVIEDDNQQIVIRDIVQAPAAAIDNDDEGSFRFTISDPERHDSTWRVRKIAGDSVSFLPHEGDILNGLGDASVAFDDRVDNTNGYLVFEISAYDDDLFGLTANATRAVQLVTFTTRGQLSDSAPQILRVEFIPAASQMGGVPGQEGIITFEFTDPDTLTLRWQVSIIAGDFGGLLDRGSGTVSTGAGEIEVRYVDDPDTPTDPVVFLIQVVEQGTSNPQSDIFVLRVDKGPTLINPGDDPGTGGTNSPIGFVYEGLFGNQSGEGAKNDLLEDFTVFLDNSDPANPRFFRDMALTQEIGGASLVFDVSHTSNDPSQLSTLSYSRDFASPINSDNNTGFLFFRGYYASAGAESAPSPTPIQNGVGRWYMPFDIEDFRPTGSGPFNFPISGTMLYEAAVTVTESGGESATLIKTVRVVVP